MHNYKELYEHYEGTANHDGTHEVTAAEEALAELIKTIPASPFKTTLDQAIGSAVRAYEMQGFKMGYDVATIMARRATL